MSYIITLLVSIKLDLLLLKQCDIIFHSINYAGVPKIVKRFGLVRKFILLTFVCSLLLSSIAPLKQPVNAASDSLWANNESLNIKLGDSPTTTIPAISQGQDCFTTTFIVKKFNPSGNNPVTGLASWVVAPDQKLQVCAAQTPLGFIAQVGSATYVQFQGSNYAQKLWSGGGNSIVTAFPVPGKHTLVVQTKVATSYAIPKTYFFYNILAAGEQSMEGGELVFKIKSFPANFQDQNGGALEMSSFTFSRDGEWMLAIVGGVIMRVNVATKAMQTFSRAVVGQGYAYTMALSNDGRYAFVQPFQPWSSSQYIYDLAGCQTNVQYYMEPQTVAGCILRNISGDIRSKVNTLLALENVRFNYNTQEITGIATYWKSAQVPGPSEKKIISIAKQGYVPPTLQYLGMGDSFSSGEGDTQGGSWYEPGTDTAQNKCHLSRRSYPYLLALQLGLHEGLNKTPLDNSLFHSVACSGAVSARVLERPQYETGNTAGWLAGSLQQIKWAEDSKPKVITISMIGNDIGFKDKLIRCLAPDTCFRSYEERLAILKEIQGKFTALNSMYRQMQRASPGVRIYVLGYPQIASTNTECGANVLLDSEERELSQGLVRYMNATVKAAAANAGVAYIDVENAFTNKQLCDGPQEGLAVNGLTAGNDILSVLGNESYHPNPVGHVLFAEKVMRQSDGLAKPMPIANTTIMAPDPLAPEFSAFLNVPRDGGPIRNLIYEGGVVIDGALDVVVRGTPQYKTIRALASSNYELWLNSEPVFLGSFTPSQEGILSLNFTVPPDTAPGFHTLHLYGKNTSGEDLDIYKTIFVAASATDYDGDGIANAEDSCDAFAPSGQDMDKDGIDDICDGFMDEIPPAPTPVVMPVPIPVPDPIDSGDNFPKPPENNPETEAGNETIVTPPLNNILPLVITTAAVQPIIPVNIFIAAFTPSTVIQDTPPAIDIPQVAGVNTKTETITPDNAGVVNPQTNKSGDKTQMIIKITLGFLVILILIAVLLKIL